MGEILKKFFKYKRFKFRLLIIIIIIILLLIFSAALYFITIDDGVSDGGNTPAVASQKASQAMTQSSHGDGQVVTKDLKTKSSSSGGYAIDIKFDELVNDIIQELEQNGENLYAYINEGNANEYMQKLMKTHLITQYPDLRSADKIGTPVPEGEFQGIIRFVRHKMDGTQTLLEYIPLGNEDAVNNNTMYGLINQANGKGGVSQDVIQSARSKLLTCFSIDIDENLILPKWIETTTKTVIGEYITEYKPDEEEMDYSNIDRYNVDGTTTTIYQNLENKTYEYSAHIVNYKSSISKYTMPFNYLWAFLVCGRDEQFVSDFADLVADSSIQISIYENLVENQLENITAYNNNEWQSIKTSDRVISGTTIGDSMESQWSEPEFISTKHHYQTNYKRTYTNSIVIAPTDVDIWYMKYKANYTYETEDSEEQKNISRKEGTTKTNVQEGEWQIISNDTEIQKNEFGLMVQVPVIRQEKTDTEIKNIYNQYTDTSFERTIQYNYTLDGVPYVEEKTNRKLEEGDDGYPNFCTLYLSSKSARGNIDGVEEWLFEIIQNNTDTVNMLELTKYLFYCTTQKQYGVTSFNFERLYGTNTIGELYGDTVEEKVWFALIDAGFSKEATAGVLGNLKSESGIISNNLENKYEEIIGMDDEQYTSSVDSLVYTNFVTDKCGYGIAQWTSEGRKKGLYAFAQEKGVSISDVSMQIEYLLGEISWTGGANGHATFQMAKSHKGYSYSSWVNATTPEDAAIAFCYVFERPKEPNEESRKSSARYFYEKYANTTK